MALNIPPSQSNGPDKIRLHPNCSEHQAGKRTGLKDSCCCCNPCLYRTLEDSDLPPEDQHCCRCNPRFITAIYTPNNTDPPNECCRNVVSPLAAEPTPEFETHGIQYVGNVVGYNIYVYLSRERISGSTITGYDEMECRWTIRIPELSIDQEIEIDHTQITCLGVPSIEILNVLAFAEGYDDGCIGKITLGNLDTAKVPFRRRTFPDEFADGEDTLVTLPTLCGECTQVPRFLCVSGKRHAGLLTLDVRGAELLELEWEQYYGGFQCGDNFVVGRWSGINGWVGEEAWEYIYLIQDYYGECFLWTAFEFDTTCSDRTPELFPVISLSECGCDIKELNVLPLVVDPAHPTIGVNIRSGACTCWSWQCERCRCVPRYLCAIGYLGGVMVKDIRFVWNGATKSWKETDDAGNIKPSGLEIKIIREPLGGRADPTTSDHDFLSYCTLRTEINGYQTSIDHPVRDWEWDTCGPIQDMEFQNAAEIGGKLEDYGWLIVRTSFDAKDCAFDLSCQEATPCGGLCGSHPDEVFVDLLGWNPPWSEPGFEYESCFIEEMKLLYWEQISYSGGEWEIICGYAGNRPYSWIDVHGNTVYGILSLRLREGVVSVSTTDGYNEAWDLDSETCNPYEAGLVLDAEGPAACIFDPDVTVHEYILTIIE